MMTLSGDPMLPPTIVIVMTLALCALLIYNVIADVSVRGYDGYPTTLLLGTIVGAMLGIQRYMRVGK